MFPVKRRRGQISCRDERDLGNLFGNALRCADGTPAVDVKRIRRVRGSNGTENRIAGTSETPCPGRSLNANVTATAQRHNVQSAYRCPGGGVVENNLGRRISANLRVEPGAALHPTKRVSAFVDDDIATTLQGSANAFHAPCFKKTRRGSTISPSSLLEVPRAVVAWQSSDSDIHVYGLSDDGRIVVEADDMEAQAQGACPQGNNQRGPCKGNWSEVAAASIPTHSDFFL